MGGKSVKTPPSPDPTAVAAAQTGSNLTTAIGNTWLQNANYKTPWGSTTTQQTGTRRVTDPSTGKTYDVPTFTYTTNLSANQKKLLEQQEKLGMGLNDMAQGQVDRLSKHLSQPLNLDGIQEVGNFDEYQRRYEDAIKTRLGEDLDKQQSALETRLINQGLQRGTVAFDRAMQENARARNDANVAAFLASGAEARNAGQYDMGLRNQSIAERLMLRNQPINEVTALMSGGQVNVPQLPGFSGANMSETPIGNYMYQNWAQNNQRAQQQAQANGQLWSAIGNVGAGLFAWSDARLKRNPIPLGPVNGRMLYAYQYLWSDAWEIGVMAQENPDIAVLMPNGFYAVDYGRL